MWRSDLSICQKHQQHTGVTRQRTATRMHQSTKYWHGQRHTSWFFFQSLIEFEILAITTTVHVNCIPLALFQLQGQFQKICIKKGGRATLGRADNMRCSAKNELLERFAASCPNCDQRGLSEAEARRELNTCTKTRSKRQMQFVENQKDERPWFSLTYSS